MNADQYPGLQISRANNSLVYVKGPKKLVTKYKNETKNIKSVRRPIKTTKNVKE